MRTAACAGHSVEAVVEPRLTAHSDDIVPTRRPSPFSSLRDRRYRAWFATQVLSTSGVMTQAVAAAWLVLHLTGRALDLAVLPVLTVGPTLLLGAAGGVLADRVDRRRLLVATQVASFAIGAALALVTWSGHTGLAAVYVASFLSGVVLAFDGPARQVFVLDLVGGQRLASAVSLYEVVQNASRVLGPAFGGLLLAAWGPAACFGLNALSYLPPLAVLVAVHTRRAVVATAADHAPAPVSLSAGLRYAWGTPVIRGCLVLAACTTTLFNPSVVFPVLATRSFHLGAGGFGLLVASFGVGALPGALAAAGGRPPTGRRVSVLSLVTAAAVVLTACAPSVWLASLGMAVVGFTSIWFIAAANTLVQLRSAPELRGRVMGVWTMALPGTGPLFALAVGELIDVTSPRLGLAAAGLLLGAGAVLSWRWLAADAAVTTAAQPALATG